MAFIPIIPIHTYIYYAFALSLSLSLFSRSCFQNRILTVSRARVLARRTSIKRSVHLSETFDDAITSSIARALQCRSHASNRFSARAYIHTHATICTHLKIARVCFAIHGRGLAAKLNLIKLLYFDLDRRNIYLYTYIN